MRHGSTLAALATGALLVGGCLTPKQPGPGDLRWSQMRGRVKLQQAEQHFQNGQFEPAAKAAAEAIALEPGQSQGYLLLARSNVELNRTAEALRAIEAAAQAGVNSVELVYTRGVLLELRGEPAGALEAYAEAHRQSPGDVDFLAAYAECLVSAGRGDEAMKVLEESLLAATNDATVVAMMAHVAGTLGSRGNHLAAGREARMVSRESRLLAEELGRRLAGAGECREALSVLEPLLAASTELEPGGAVRRAAASCYLATGEAAAAKAVLADYVLVHPDDALANLLLAKAALSTGDITSALWAVDRVQQREPHRPDLWLVRAAVQWKRGNLAAAASDLLDVIRNDPNDVEAHCLLAEVYRAQRRADAARGQFERALALDPGCGWASAGLRSLRDAPSPGADEPPEAKLTAAGTDIPALPETNSAPRQ